MSKTISFLLLLFLVGCANALDPSKPAIAPVPIERAYPTVPEILTRGDIAGTVELSALVDESGRVVDTKIVQSLGLVDTVCLEAAKKWRFNAGQLPRQNGEYVPAHFWVPIFFHWEIGAEHFVRLEP